MREEELVVEMLADEIGLADTAATVDGDKLRFVFLKIAVECLRFACASNLKSVFL